MVGFTEITANINHQNIKDPICPSSNFSINAASSSLFPRSQNKITFDKGQIQFTAREISNAYNYLAQISGNEKEFEAYFPKNHLKIFERYTGFNFYQIISSEHLQHYFSGIFNKAYFKAKIIKKKNREKIYINLQNQKLKILPRQILEENNIFQLNISYNRLLFLPWGSTLFKQLKILKAKCNAFQYIPAAVYQAEKIEVINLAYNRIRRFNKNALLPPRLIYLNCKANHLKKLPNLSLLPHLKKLNLSHNHIKKIPDTFKYRHALQKCNLRDNKIKKLPVGLLKYMPQLQKMNLSNNPISDEERYWIQIYWQNLGNNELIF